MVRDVKIIFLDCDGVISPFSNGEVFQRSKMLLLKKIIDEASFSGPKKNIPVEIVLSSSWRATDFGRREVAKHLAIYGMRSFISCTPDLCFINSRTPRSVEILQWIEENRDKYNVVNFIALDDINLPALAPNKEFFAKHAIVTNGATGLTKEDAERAVQLLSDANNIVQFSSSSINK